MLGGIGHEHCLPHDPSSFQGAIQQLAGRTNERMPGGVLLIAGLLSDEHQTGLLRAPPTTA